MKKNSLLYLAVVFVLSVSMLAGCGRLVKSSNAGGSSALSGQSSDSSVQGSAQDIDKMLSSIQNDTASIAIDDGSGTAVSTDSTIDEINSSLSGNQDDITGLNQ